MPIMGGGLSAATLATANREKKRKKRAKGTAEEAVSGAATGASAGLGGGPIGAIAGAGLGAIAGAADARRGEKQAEAASPRPKRRRLTRALEGFEETKRKRQGALAALSQTVFDFASSLR